MLLDALRGQIVTHYFNHQPKEMKGIYSKVGKRLEKKNEYEIKGKFPMVFHILNEELKNL